mmetsp:Transcript_27983/g.71517  ORF Transcript_27983/g.71517 Transcript_27983/m.71517 type:complete len:95 (-) Transcript_27983:600-884(-)
MSCGGPTVRKQYSRAHEAPIMLSAATKSSARPDATAVSHAQSFQPAKPTQHNEHAQAPHETAQMAYVTDLHGRTGGEALLLTLNPGKCLQDIES